MKKNAFRYPSFFIGIISLLVVIIVLILSSFAVLSYANSRADLKLAEKTAASMKAYYSADSAALNKLSSLEGSAPSDLNALLSDCEEATVTQSAANVYTVSFCEKTSDTGVLSVSAEFESSSGILRLVKINKWQSESRKEAANADK